MVFNGKAWEKSLEELRPLLRFIAGQSLNPRHWRRVDPSDMVQKTLLEAHEKRADFRGSSEEELEAWLKGILGHRIIDVIRNLGCDRNGGGRVGDLEGAEDQVRRWTSPLSALIRNEEARRLAEALEKLPDDQRRVVECNFFHRLTLAETADVMNQSRHAVARLLRRALARLHELLR